MRGLDGRRVLVTGAASGIGRAVAERFAADGALLFLGDRDAAGLDAVRSALPGGPHHAAAADLSDPAAVEAVVPAAVAALGGLDVLVNNAGFVVADALDSPEMAAFDGMMAVNLRAAVVLARAAARQFVASGTHGAILNTTSVHDTIPKPGFLGYATGKAALAAATRTLALELAVHGIRVNAVGPGAVATPMNASWTGDATRRAAVNAHIPMGRAAEPAEIAAAFAFLASDDASYVTGQVLHVDGGLTLFPEFRENWAT